jgi:hypothetical protein
VEKSHFLPPWLVAPDATLFFLVHMIVTMALSLCWDHYLLCYCSQVLSTTRTVMFVAFFNEKSHSEVWSCWRPMLPCSFLSIRLWYLHSLLYSFTLNTTACNDVSTDSTAIVCSPLLCTVLCFEVLCLILISCHHSSSIFSCDDTNNEMYDFLLVTYTLSLAPFYYHYVDG